MKNIDLNIFLLVVFGPSITAVTFRSHCTILESCTFLSINGINFEGRCTRRYNYVFIALLILMKFLFVTTIAIATVQPPPRF